MVGSGFFHAPFTPSIPGLGEFEGEVSHSITYRRPEKFKGKTVLVVGNAHSAGDIAVDASRVAKKVHVRPLSLFYDGAGVNGRKK